MENSINCKEHNKPLLMICSDCDSLLCLKCLESHSGKSCRYPISITTYAEKLLLPKCKEDLDAFENRRQILEEVLKDFVSASASIKKGLTELKKNAERLLENINKSLEYLQLDEQVIISSNNIIKRKLEQKYKDLKRAIETENIEYIMDQVQNKAQEEQYIIDDSGKPLAKALDKAISNLLESQVLNSLNDSLNEFNSRYKKIMDNKDSLNTRTNFYAISSSHGNCNKLCKYDIDKGKFNEVIEVPQYCSIVHIKNLIFITGGNNPCVNTVSEFVERTGSLVPKEPMLTPKCYHAIQTISNNVFVTVGGYFSTAIADCEEYSVLENKWSKLPTLNRARDSPGVAFLNYKYLYAIGGYKTAGEIEMLNIMEKRAWIIVNMNKKDLSISNGPAAFPVSHNEIMILEGNNTNLAGIFNVEKCTVERTPYAVLIGKYYCKTVVVIREKVYIVGYEGNYHVYDIKKKEFNEKKYEDTVP